MWKVKSDTCTVYLFGSIHVAKPDLYPLADNVLKAFDSCAELAVEVNPQGGAAMQMQTAILTRGVYPAGKTIDDEISEETAAALNKYLTTRNMNTTQMKAFKPGVLSITLTMLEMFKHGYKPALGVDVHFINRASEKQRPIRELETAEQQIALIVDNKDGDAFLKHTLLDLENMDETMGEMVQAWKDGDAEKLDKMLIADPLKAHEELKGFYESFFFARNVKMATTLRTWLKDDVDRFVVVGAGHLTGEKGVPALLQKDFSVQRVE
jgi:uncharacterized protein YbaP (TraB family)